MYVACWCKAEHMNCQQAFQIEDQKCFASNTFTGTFATIWCETVIPDVDPFLSSLISALLTSYQTSLPTFHQTSLPTSHQTFHHSPQPSQSIFHFLCPLFFCISLTMKSKKLKRIIFPVCRKMIKDSDLGPSTPPENL